MLIRDAEPWLVTSTNQGRARNVIALPEVETSSATSSALRVRFRIWRK
jgi:hypothetical protein